MPRDRCGMPCSDRLQRRHGRDLLEIYLVLPDLPALVPIANMPGHPA